MEAALMGFRQRPRWLFAVLALILAQGYLTVQTFGGSERLFDDEPIVDGRHPLHLYHGWLGVNRWLSHGTSCAYDPAFQAGYPKTPIFDNGSRPAELFLLFAGGEWSPRAYKVGIALCCVFAPLAFVVMARGIGLSPASACLAGLIGIASWWSEPVRGLVMEGDFDLLLGGFCVLIYMTWLIRFDRWPGLVAWGVLALTGCLGWNTVPLLWLAFLPVATLFYLWAGAKQGVGWHLAVLAATLIGLAVNAFWLWEWVRFGWLVAEDLRAWPPLQLTSPGWGELADFFREQPVNASIIVGGIAGLLVCGYRRHYAASVFLGAALAGLLFVVRVGRDWEPLAAMGSAKLLVLAGWVAVCPCAALLAQLAKVPLVGRKHPVRFGAAGLVLTAGVLAALGPLDKCVTTESAFAPFEVGLSPEREAAARGIREATSASARTLWQERDETSCWTALLPQRTGRVFLGGLDAGTNVEHMYARLTETHLAGRPLDAWSDAELTRFCERYNVGWVVCSSAEALRRFRDYPHAREMGQLSPGSERTLFEVRRTHSYILIGKGEWVQADARRIALADVVPVDGVVTLSIHYQTGWQVSPGYVTIERELDAHDPIAFIRLRMPGPVARLTLSWENP